MLDEADLGLHGTPGAGGAPASPAAPLERAGRPLKDEVEQRRILDALATCDGNQTQAAKLLGISRGTLVSRLERFGVSRPRTKR